MAGSSFISTSDVDAQPVRVSRHCFAGVRLAFKIVLAVVYTLVVSEAFVRCLNPQPIMPRYVTGTPWGVRGNIPGASYWHSTPETHVSFRINAEGMRDDRTFSMMKPIGTCRVELFGDSFFMGYELNLHSTFAYDLERMLRERGYNVEVLNFAVSGFGTSEMLRTYEAYGRRFHPNLAIFSWHSSDFYDNMLSGLYKLAGDRLVKGNAIFLPSVDLQDDLMRWAAYRWVADNSQLYALLRERASALSHHVIGLLFKRSGEGEGGSEPVTTAANGLGFLTNPYATSLSAAILGRARDVTQADHVGFMVTEIPFRVNSHDFRSSADLLPDDLRKTLTMATPLTAFLQQAKSGKAIYYERGEGHVTPLGASLLARSALDTIVKMPVWASCRHPRYTMTVDHGPL